MTEEMLNRKYIIHFATRYSVFTSISINVTHTTFLHKTLGSKIFQLPVKYLSNMHHARSKLFILHAQIN